MRHPVDATGLDNAGSRQDESRLVEELRGLKSQRSPRQARIAEAARILVQTHSPRVRNAAALALVDLRAHRASDPLLSLLTRSDTKGSRGTLLYALEQLRAHVPLPILVNIIAEESYEAREEALSLLDRRLIDCSPEDLSHARITLEAALTSAHDERSRAITRALEYLRYELTEYAEIEDIPQIEKYSEELSEALKSLSSRREVRKIARFAVSRPNEVYFFERERWWWSPRRYPVEPKVATQANNLFGYGVPGGTGDLIAVVEVNLPLGRFRRNLQGVFVKNLATNSIVLARRDQVTISLHKQVSISETLKVPDSSLIYLSGNRRLFRVCNIQEVRLKDIRKFLEIVYEAKEILRHKSRSAYPRGS